MKGLTKICAAALVAVAASMAFGVGSAAAVDYTVLCKKNESPCKAENLYKGGETIVAHAQSVQVEITFALGGTIFMDCNESVVEGKTGEEFETPHLSGIIQTFDLNECSIPATGGKCIMTTQNTPWASLLSQGTGGNGGLLAYELGSEAPPLVGVSCDGIFPVKCIAYFNESDEQVPGKPVGYFSVFGDSVEPLIISGQVLKVESPKNEPTKCLGVKSATYSAEYIVQEPKPIWVSHHTKP